jgi:hypothetical protein
MRTLVFVILCCLAGLPALAAINTLPPPVVVVYPLVTSGSADPQAGGRLAIIFAQRLADAGGVTVKPATPGTPRKQYLEAARTLGADYYVTGYMTPLGNEVSLIVQIVSTYSGIVVWSNTTQVRTYEEAAGQAAFLREAIVRHAGRTLAALDQPAPLPTTTPTPPGTGGNLNRLFTRRPKSTPEPKPAATAAATTTAPASPGASRAAPASPAASRAAPASPAASRAAAIVVEVGGDAQPQERTYASTALAAAIAKQGLGGTLIATSSSADLPAHAKDLCGASGAASIFAGALSVKHIGGFIRAATADFDLVRYECSGSVTTREHAQTQATGRSDTTVAIDRAIAKTVGAALPPPKTTAH